MEKKLYTDDMIKQFLSESESWLDKADRLVSLFVADDWLHDRGVKMHDCGDWLTFDKVIDFAVPPAAASETAFHLTRSNYCRQRLCPVCQWRRSRAIFAHLTDVWAVLKDSGYDVLHAVFTLRNVDEKTLPDEITRMFKSYSKMMKSNELSGWKGCLRFLEVSYNKKNDTYHPHLHCLVAVKPSYFKSRYYVPQAKLRELWRDALRADYLPLCYVQKCDPSAILEVSKYCVKPFDFDDLSPETLLNVYRCFDSALHGRRLIQSYGVLRQALRDCKLNAALEEETDETPDDVPDLLTGGSSLHLVYRYNHDTHRYESL